MPSRGSRAAAEQVARLERDLDPAAPPPTHPELARYRQFAWWLDESIKLPFVPFRIGLDAVVGLLPGAGDLVVGTMGAYALVVAWRLGAPAWVLGRMLANIGTDTILGAVPLLGDLFDAAFKANTRNRRLLEEWVARPGHTSRRSAAWLVASILVLVAMLAGSLWLAWKAVAEIIRMLA
jgi:hypothetical protein